MNRAADALERERPPSPLATVPVTPPTFVCGLANLGRKAEAQEEIQRAAQNSGNESSRPAAPKPVQTVPAPELLQDSR